MTFEEFCNDIETAKKTAHKKAWFVLGGILDGSETSSLKLKGAMYLVNRFEGEPTKKQEVTGKDGAPIFLPSEIMHKNNIHAATPSTTDDSEGHAQVPSSELR